MGLSSDTVILISHWMWSINQRNSTPLDLQLSSGSPPPQSHPQQLIRLHDWKREYESLGVAWGPDCNVYNHFLTSQQTRMWLTNITSSCVGVPSFSLRHNIIIMQSGIDTIIVWTWHTWNNRTVLVVWPYSYTWIRKYSRAPPSIKKNHFSTHLPSHNTWQMAEQPVTWH